MKYLSVCSGIEAASVAWHPLGWDPVAFSEIEAFPSAVLAHRFPSVPNLGDMTKFKEWEIGRIDALVGGTPCQSFSVAGLRRGLEDPRGNLMLTYGAIADHFKPTWIVWENVPGVLSSNRGKDFGTFLGMLGELGYGFAYRVLDAQYFGVAQRRRRVFVVGYLGDWRPPAAVLFESESLRWNPAPSREAREGSTPGASRGAVELYENHAQDSRVRRIDLPTIHAKAGTGGGNLPILMASEVVGSLSCNTGPKGHDAGNFACNQAVAAGHVIPVVMAHGQANAEIRMDGGAPALTCNHEAPILSYGIPGNWIGRKPENGGNAVEPMHEVAPCLTGADRHGVAKLAPVAFDGYNQTISETVQTLRADKSDGDHVGMILQSAVRRLTPKECERLQGFPDDWTLIQWRGKLAPDGPRYKACGNSMAVPVMRWIGERIEKYREIF